MSETPPSYSAAPPAPAPAQRRLPTWAIVVGVLALVCICAGCAIALFAGGPLGTGALAGGQLIFTCMEKVNDQNVCGAWAQQVVNTPEFNTCIGELMTDGNLNGDSLYACLEEKGVGP